MRPEDLVPSFLWELEHQDKLTREHRKLISEINSRIDTDDYYDSDDADYDLGALFDALQEYCMPYFYFGAHPGDGADYGYWLSEYMEYDFEGLKVSDLSEVETGYTGEVLHVNDHGNMSLYQASNGRLYEVWAIV